MDTNQTAERDATESLAELYSNVGPNPLAKAIIEYNKGNIGTPNFNFGLNGLPSGVSSDVRNRADIAAAARGHLARISASTTFYTTLSRIRRHRAAVAV